ncbi:HigA family addiction module antitoxin [Pusillimonas sp.]|uniref:HigA family addiction module antitoxin n=1 Tax=Pusillimonas sp. TaxID=3040095 RepID=UPI0037C5CB16
MRMQNPAHPGIVLREYLGELTVTEAAAKLAVTRAALSRILNGSAGISAEMALRLRDALGTSAQMWLNMQAQYDLWQAENKPDRPVIAPIHETAMRAWLLDEVAPTYDATEADPARVVTQQAVKEALAAEHKKTNKIR